MENDIIYSRQRVEYRQIVCSQRYAVLTSLSISAVILLISIIAAFARAPCACFDQEAKAAKLAAQRDGNRNAIQSPSSVDCPSDFTSQRLVGNGSNAWSGGVESKCSVLTSRLTLFPLLVSDDNRLLFGIVNMTFVCQEATEVLFLQVGRLNIRRVTAASVFGNASASRSVYDPLTVKVSECAVQRRAAVRFGRAVGRNEQVLLNVEYVLADWSDVAERYSESGSTRGLVTLFGFSVTAVLFPTVSRDAVATYTLSVIRAPRSQSVANTPLRFGESVTFASLVSTFDIQLQLGRKKRAETQSEVKARSNTSWSADLSVMAALRRDAVWYADRYEAVLCAAHSLGFALLDRAADWLSLRAQVSDSLATRFWSLKPAADNLANETRRALAAFASRTELSSLPFSTVQLLALPPVRQAFGGALGQPAAYRTGYAFVAVSAQQTDRACVGVLELRSVVSEAVVELFLLHMVSTRQDEHLRGLLAYCRLSLQGERSDAFFAEKFAPWISLLPQAQSQMMSASVFASIANSLGRLAFEGALGRFVERFQSTHASALEFLNFLTRSGNSVANGAPSNWSQLATAWTNRTDYPIITVVRVDQTSYKLQQAVFSAEPSVQSLNHSLVTYSGSTDNDTWPLLIRYRTEQESGTWYVTQRQHTVQLQVANQSQFLLINSAGLGYYRVHYGADWPLLIDKLLQDTTERFSSPLQRAAIVDDALNLMTAGLLEPQVALRVLKIMSVERDNVVWSTLLRLIDWLSMLLADYDQSLETYELWRTHILTMLDSSVSKQISLQYDKLSSQEKLVHLAVMETGLRFGHRDAINYLLGLLSRKETCEIELRRMIEKAMVQYDPNQLLQWNNLWNAVQRPSSDCERRAAALDVLASSRDAMCMRKLLTNLLAFRLSSNDLQWLLVRMASQSTAHRAAVLQFVSSNWPALSSLLSSAEQQSSLLLLAALFTDESDAQLPKPKQPAYDAEVNRRIVRAIAVNSAVKQRIVPSIQRVLQQLYFDKAANSVAWHSKDINWYSV